jgi:coenzyme F420-0:L-glutamate ligase / coenzyme F420-1:gamma-L-glutamate ligase
MKNNTNLHVIPIAAPVRTSAFPLASTVRDAIMAAGEQLQTGDILAISSKYVAISQNRIVRLADVQPQARAQRIAARYNMDARLVELIVQESDHIFGGIGMGFLLTHTQHGVISPNAGLDQSNIPTGNVVLLPEAPYPTTAALRTALQAATGAQIGVLMTDSWLMPGRYGTTGVAIAAAGFEPLQDERGKPDLFGNPMRVTQRSIADTLTSCAEMVMGERAEAIPIAIIRHAHVSLTERSLSAADIAIPWELCIYVESLTAGKLVEEA